MSRIGKKPAKIPAGVKVSVDRMSRDRNVSPVIGRLRCVMDTLPKAGPLVNAVPNAGEFEMSRPLNPEPRSLPQRKLWLLMIVTPPGLFPLLSVIDVVSKIVLTPTVH